jgi:hypothetical protein
VRISRQQFIAFSCALLLQLALFASFAHAAEHPFHVQSDLCSSFINFGQHDMAVDAAPASIVFKVFSVEHFTENRQRIPVIFRPFYSSRAPPVS